MLKSNMKLIIVTNRKLAKSNFLKQVEAWAKVGPSALILREKIYQLRTIVIWPRNF